MLKRLSLVLLLTVLATSAGDSRFWRDVVHVKSQYQAGVWIVQPTRPLSLLVVQEAGPHDTVKGDWMKCDAQIRTRPIEMADGTKVQVGETLLNCETPTGHKLFVVKGFAGGN